MNPQIRANLEAMRQAPARHEGMDVIIVSTGSAGQEGYWQQRLEATLGEVTKPGAIVVAVNEDWPGGAGNGLGTLYAWQQARAKAKARFQIDIMDRLERGAAIGLYHTAGKGTRLAPLPGSENNNKPAIRLPGLLGPADGPEFITVLEAVIRQTALYAATRQGRLSVFWGDGVFIPANPIARQPTHHADILALLGPMPDAAEWGRRGLERYGLIAVDGNGDAAQVEKISYQQAANLIDTSVIGVDNGIGVSLGSFSMSAALAAAMLAEFDPELQAHAGKFDTDPHFWMPTTLDQATYTELMVRKGEDASGAQDHFRRLASFKERFMAAHGGQPFFGAVDVGEGSYWWDYGNLQPYHDNILKITGNDAEAEAVRLFFDLADPLAGSALGDGLAVDERSCVVGCQISSGRVRNSVLVGVQAKHVEVEDTVLIQVAAPEIAGASGLFYNVADQGPLRFEPGCVRADAFLPGAGSHAMRTRLDRDGRADWEQRLPGNPMSFADLHLKNQGLDPVACEQMARAARQKIAASFP